PGNHMARVVIPGGVVTSAQARNIAKISEDYGMGILNVTTRQAIQFHWLKVGRLADMIRDLNKEGSTTMHGCGDVTRNVAACPLAETCKYRRFNVRPISIETSDYLGACKDLDNLPRKFKITYSGCSAGCAQPYINCLGAVATIINYNGKERKGFKVIIGGGMGWKAFVGQELFSFVPRENMVKVSRAIAILFREHGDRFDRTKSRLKFVVYRYGIEKCRELVLQYLQEEGVPTEGILTEPVEDVGVAVPERPLTEEHPSDEKGRHTVDIMVPKGELTFQQFHRIAVLSEMYGNQRVYTTNRQNLQLKGVEPGKLEEVKREVEKLGFITTGFFGLKDIVPCVGITYCPKAVTTTRDLYDAIYPVVSLPKYKDIEKKGIINITGCPNSCSPFRISDIGFRGMRIREEFGSVEGYEMLIGGSQTDFGKKLGEFKKEDIPEIVEIVLDTFLRHRQPDETLTSCVNRVGEAVFFNAVYHEPIEKL
ncbi:MAG: nitrite/sulfite reductase, partial [Bacteroidales bacterium]|nr:nitrite/sulfite reductase [Bacteroidales bacterium]